MTVFESICRGVVTVFVGACLCYVLATWGDSLKSDRLRAEEWQAKVVAKCSPVRP